MKSYKLKPLLLFLTLIIAGCSDKEVYETVEVYSIVNYSAMLNDEGIFGETGYFKGNSITFIEESKNMQKTKVYALEDYYDQDGNYKHSKIAYSEFEKNLIVSYEQSSENMKEVYEPVTILAPALEEGELSAKIQLTHAESEKVKAHIMEFIRTIDE